MLKKIQFSFIMLTLAMSAAAQAQGPLRTFRVAIFSPLYLDSAFSDNNYRYGKSFPKFTLQGFDFAEGAQMALDSIDVPNGNIVATIYDSKSKRQNISSLINNRQLDSVDLIIGAVKDEEFTGLSAFAKRKNIPFISATLPNDGGVTDNPFLVIVNSTLRAHCEAIYAYVLQNHGSDRIFLCKRKGAQEDKIAEYFKNINTPDGKPLLDLRIVNCEDDFAALLLKLDSTKNNILIGGSLNENFASDMVNLTYPFRNKYPMQIIGMPNWDGFSELRKASLKDYPIIFTTPYYNAKTDWNSTKIRSTYLRRFKGNPSEMAYKGYELATLFSRILLAHPNDFSSHLNDYTTKIFNDYNFKPVYSNKNPMPDYFENKHVYFMKLENGRSSRLQ